MLGSSELLEALRGLKAAGKTSNADLARLLKLPSARVSEIFDDKRRITIDEMKSLVEHFQLDGQPRLPAPPANDDTVEIIQLDLSLSMGPGTLIDDYVEGTAVRFDLAFIRAITRSASDRLRLVKGIGDSMYPTLNGGDVIMIDTTQRSLVRQDGVYWVSIYGAAGIKRLRTVGPQRILVVSDNPTIDNYEVDAEDVRIEGRAIWFARDL